LLLVLVLLGVTFVTLSSRSGNGGVFARARSYARDIANPFQSGAHAVLEPVGNFIYGALNYGSLEKQNELLRQQVAGDQAAEVQADGAENEADQVLAQEHLDYLHGIQSVAAQVVDLGSANFEQSIEIDRGLSSGVAQGQPVVSSGGLIGSVTSVSSGLATVTLVDDPGFVVGVRVLQKGVAGGGVVGAVVGEGEGNALSVEDVNVGEPVKKGDPLVTSGLTLEHFPSGIPVGTVTSVSSSEGALQLVISAQPLADLVNSQFVRVLLWSPQTGRGQSG
jgi:rod shape-determining protein MreC